VRLPACEVPCLQIEHGPEGKVPEGNGIWTVAESTAWRWTSLGKNAANFVNL
jgi:hypothetical protein